MTRRGFLVCATALALVLSACSSGGARRGASTTTTSNVTSTTAVRPASVSCPGRLPARPTNAGVVGLVSKLVPVEATRLAVCRYDPGSRRGALSEQFTLTDPMTVSQFEERANALPDTGKGEFHCPNDNGSAMLVRFADVSHVVAVRISLSGCRFASNGTRTVQSTTAWAKTVASIRVANCPDIAPDAITSPKDRRVSGLDRVLVPITATSARVCRYAPLRDSHPNILTGFGVLADPTSARRLTAVANGLGHISNAERIPCPLNMIAPNWLVTFGNDTSQVAVLVSQNDCGFTTNGTLTATSSQTWLSALAARATLH